MAAAHTLIEMAAKMGDGGYVLNELVGRRELSIQQKVQIQRMRIALMKGTDPSASLTEEHVRAYATYFYHVLANRIAELHRPNTEPVDCEVVIPVNIIPPNPTEAIEKSVQIFRERRSVT